MGDKTLEEDSADEKLDYNLQTQNFSSLSGSASNICWVNIKVNYSKSHHLQGVQEKKNTLFI